MKVSTSVLSIYDNVENCIDKLNQSTSDYLHLDVMDGKFVSQNTVNIMDEVLKYNKLPLDIHLMVEEVPVFINKYQDYKPVFITFHIETKIEHMKLIKDLKEKGIKVGLSINPDTDINLLNSYLDELDLILVMSVTPGAGGQSFNEMALEKINYLYEQREKNNYHYLIEVDGGINENTIKFVQKADIVVSGSYITSGVYEERIQILKNI